MRRFWLILALILVLSLIAGNTAFAAGGQVIHQVALGENLGGIAARYGVTVEAIMRANGLANPDMIYEGQRLVIPVNTSGRASGCAYYHTVKAGETLSDIAWVYDTTVEALARLNNLQNEDIVYADTRLCLPAGGRYAPQATARQNYGSPPAAHYHTVTKGETLSGIAWRYGVKLEEIARANNLGSQDYIQAGQRLAIPGYQPPVAPPSSRPKRPDNAGSPPGPAAGPGPSTGPDSAYKTGQPDQPGQAGPGYKPGRAYKSDPGSVYVRLGRNVGYSYWGRPKFGLDDCTIDWYDDSDPVKRLTVEVLLTNNSKQIIPKEWASTSNIVFHLASGGYRYPCKYRYGYGQDPKDIPPNVTINYSAGENPYPGDLKPSETADVTFYTHLEKGDLVNKIEFTKLGVCFDPGNGDPVPCGPGYY